VCFGLYYGLFDLTASNLHKPLKPSPSPIPFPSKDANKAKPAFVHEKSLLQNPIPTQKPIKYMCAQNETDRSRDQKKNLQKKP